MVGDEKNLKDSQLSTSVSVKDIASSLISYSKTNKLITALYIVTDIIDKDEPIRHKLRHLGADIVSDIHSNFSTQSYHFSKMINRIDEVVYFLNLAETLHLISGMNSSILKREFFLLKQAVLPRILDPQTELLELFKEDEVKEQIPQTKTYKPRILPSSKPARLGMQSAGGLMDALSDRISSVSNRINQSDMDINFESLRNKRRQEIVKIIQYQTNSMVESGGLTITDIRTLAVDFKSKLGITALINCGEKTLQRELASLVKEGVLKKTGSKRWSRYSVA